jgi:hypothetical protein
MYNTWITKKDGRVGRIRQSGKDAAPGPEWEKVPNDWNGNQGDKLEWFDADMRRIPDAELVMVHLIETEPASFHIVIQCRERFLTYNDFKNFKPLGMRALAEKARKKVDRLFMYRELELGIQRPISVAPAGAEYPLRL